MKEESTSGTCCNCGNVYADYELVEIEQGNICYYCSSDFKDESKDL